jgi:hypothetical protein
MTKRISIFDRALSEGRLFWRVADQYGRSCNGGDRTFQLASGTIKKPGPWAPKIACVEICSRGYHATSDPLRWQGLTVELVEVDEVCGRQGDKIVCHTMRSLGRVDPLQCVDARIFVAASRTYLTGANLTDASLTRAYLTGANLTGARYSLYTSWPQGFDPKAHGAIEVAP